MAESKKTEPKKYLLALDRGARRILLSFLSKPGWCSDNGDLFRAGDVIDLIETDADMNPKSDMDEPTMRAWLKASLPLELNERQRDTCKKCFDFFLKAAALPAGPYTNRLQAELGLRPEG